MAIEVERLIATIEANFSKYDRALNKALGNTDQKFTAIERRGAQMQKRLDSTFASFGKGFLVGAAGAIGVGTLTELPGAIRKIVGEAAGLVDVANKVGLTTTALQEFHFAATQGGASVEDFDKALGVFAKNIGAALDGTGDLGKVLEQNGIALRDQNGKVRSTSDLLKAYADVIQNAGSEQERARLVTIAFGRAGSDLANVFRDGSVSINAAAAAFRKLGGGFDEATLKQIADLDDRWDAFATTMDFRVKTSVLNVVAALDRLQNGNGSLSSRLADFLGTLNNPVAGVPILGPGVAAYKLLTTPAPSAAEDAKKKAAADIAKATAALGDALDPFLAARFDDGEWGRVAKEVIALTEEFGKGGMAVDDFDARLDALAKAQPDFRPRIEQIKSSMREILALNNAMRGVTAGGPTVATTHPLADAADRAKAAQQAEGVAALDKASKEARMTEGEKRLEAEMERLRKAIEKDHPGAIVSDAQIRDQAQKNIGIGDLNQTIDSYVNDTVKAESGGRADAKNPNSSATGLGQFITDTWVRLFKENFPDRAKGMTDAAIAAARTEAETSKTLIAAYARENAAVLQKAGVTVTEAALQLSHFLGAGDAAKVLKAAPGTPLAGLINQSSINANPTILGGGRTVDDAIAYAQSRVGQATAGAARYQANVDLGTSLEDEKKNLAFLQEEIDLRQKLGTETLANAGAYAEFRAAAQLLSQAQREGSAAGLELHTVNDLLHGDLTQLSPAAREQAEAMRALAEQYGAAADKSALVDFKQSIQSTKESAADLNEIGRDVVGGIISDLRQGKSAAEAFANALDKIGDRLINLALDAVFGSSGGGGGILSAILGGLGGTGKLFAGGGYTGDGAKYEPAGIVHRGEYVMDKATVQRIGVRNLDALRRRGARGYADGGLVTPGMLTPASLQQINRTASTPPPRAPAIVDMRMTIDTRGAAGNEEVARIAREAAAEGGRRAYEAAVATARKSQSSWMMQDRANGGGEWRL